MNNIITEQELLDFGKENGLKEMSEIIDKFITDNNLEDLLYRGHEEYEKIIKEKTRNCYNSECAFFNNQSCTKNKIIYDSNGECISNKEELS